MLKNNTVRIILLSLTILCIGACKSKKPMVGEDLKPRAIKSVINNHEKSFPEFETLSGKMRASVDGLRLSETLSITYRVEKDKQIWMSAKAFGLITVGKLYITPNRVQFYEKMNNEYFDGDFSLISNLLGVDVDFEQVQSIIFAQSLVALNSSDLRGEFDADKYIFKNTHSRAQELSMDIDAKHFRLINQKLNYANMDRNLRISYMNFQPINESFFPGAIEIFGKNEGDEMKINIDIRSINMDEELSFPFDIPSNYKEIKL